jgi:hypothetical protein
MIKRRSDAILLTVVAWINLGIAYGFLDMEGEFARLYTLCFTGSIALVAVYTRMESYGFWPYYFLMRTTGFLYAMSGVVVIGLTDAWFAGFVTWKLTYPYHVYWYIPVTTVIMLICIILKRQKPRRHGADGVGLTIRYTKNN